MNVRLTVTAAILATGPLVALAAAANATENCVLAAVLRHALARAAELKITLPIRSPATLPPVQVREAAA